MQIGVVGFGERVEGPVWWLGCCRVLEWRSRRNALLDVLGTGIGRDVQCLVVVRWLSVQAGRRLKWSRVEGEAIVIGRWKAKT